MRPGEGELAELLSALSDASGTRLDVLSRDAVARAARALAAEGESMSTLASAARAGGPSALEPFHAALSVPETYFFRHPEHFEFIERHLPWPPGRAPLRAWSAGCASGEEAYSLAACFRATLPGGLAHGARVLGTDLVNAHLVRARAGRYGGWSRRASGPMLYPLGRVDGEGVIEIDPELRAVTDFEQHNLLGPPPARAAFDLVLCRNVLLYFSPEAAERAAASVAEALAPGGVALFGLLDLGRSPDGLERLGPLQLNAFRKPEAPVAGYAERARGVPIPPSKAPSSLQRSASTVTTRGVVDQHRLALALIERGDGRAASRVLDALRREAPAYLPALFELALLRRSLGQGAEAAALIAELLARVDSLPPGAVIDGPEPLLVDYYRVAARAFLSGEHGPGGRS